MTEILCSYRIAEAQDGLEAINQVKNLQQKGCCKQFLVITMDCEMPVMDGWEATARIRQMKYKGPILGYTAYTSQNDINRCLEVGMDDVLPKPSNSQDIIDKIEELNSIFKSES